MTGDAPIQIPSYVTRLPSGKESGIYLTVDLGGTNCRICSVALGGDSTYAVIKSTISVPRVLRVNSSYEPLFDFIAVQIQAFLQKQFPLELETRSEKRHGEGSPNHSFWRLGFTFSFTCHQESQRDGRLLRWDKDWDIPAAIGRSPCKMLQDAIDALNLPVFVAVLANDSVGTLMTRAYSTTRFPKTLVGAIFGTGTNAAYVERLENVKRLHNRDEFGHRSTEDLMIINTEWGGLDEELHVLPNTRYDALLDKGSVHPGEQMLEKRMAGLYLAELFRLILLSVWETGLFNMTLNHDSPIFRREALDSSFLSLLADLPVQYLKNLLSEKFKATGMSDEDVDAIRRLAAAVVRRAARLAGIVLGATIIASGHANSKTSQIKTPEASLTAVRNELEEPRRDKILLPSFRRFWSWLGRIGCINDGDQKTSVPSPKRSSSTSHIQDSSTVRHTDNYTLDVGVDGSLIQFYPNFETEMRAALRDLPEIGVQLESQISIGFVEDGSAVGAALMASEELEIR